MARGRLAGLMGRIGALTLAVALVAAAPAFANPTSTTDRTPPTSGSAIDVGVDSSTAEFRARLAAKQAELDAFTSQLEALDKDLEVATEQYNAALVQLEEMKATVEAAKKDLANAETSVNMQTEVVGDRASTIYRDGSYNTVDILLDSKSVADFIARVKFLNTMGMRDADIAASLKGQKAQLEQRLTELENAEAVAESLEFQLKARKIEVDLRIQERQQMMASAQQELVDLLEEEAARRKAEEQALLAQVLSGASAKGITVTPGSPVETALAYHGVPYLWGGETPSGFDCSGIVLYVFRQHGVDLPHYSGSQFQLGTKVERAALIPGDVVFFGSPIHHVGIYVGGGYYLHAPRTGDFVKISSLADRSDYAGARRYDWTYRVGEPVNAVTTTKEALSKYGGTR